jgi:uncharacterized protein
MRRGSPVFVDTGAWIALALGRDPYHDRAVAIWEQALSGGSRVFTSIPVMIETFTFLDRNVTRDVALAWKDAVVELRRVVLLECKRNDLQKAWEYFARKDLHKLSAVDATSFVLMKREKIRLAFSFDHHFASAGFQMAD